MEEKDYWQGIFETKMKHTIQSLDEIKADIREIRKDINGLSYFKAKVYGFAAAWSFLAHYAIKKLGL